MEVFLQLVVLVEIAYLIVFLAPNRTIQLLQLFLKHAINFGSYLAQSAQLLAPASEILIVL